jgi:hypothetical protein
MWSDLAPAWSQVGPTWTYILRPRKPQPDQPTQGGRPVIEIGFVLNANLQTIAGANPPFTLDDPVLGELDVAELPGGDVWIDVSQWFADGLDVSRGRNRSVDLFRAGTANFRLDNRERTFDPTNLLSPFYGNLTPMRPVRISFETNGERVQVFQGFVTDWQLRYGRPSDAWVEVTCADSFILFAADELPEVSPVGDGDTSDQRIGRVLDTVGFGPQRDLSPGIFPLAETEFGVNALVHMQEAATSDNALLFMSREGVVTLRSQVAVAGSPVQVEFGQANTSDGDVHYHDVELSSSTELLFNTVSVTWAGGTVVEQDATSRAKYLPRSLSIRTLLRDEPDAELVADFALVRFAEPELRFAAVDVKVMDRRISAADRVRLCRLDVGDAVEVTVVAPGGGSPSEIEFRQIVEGVRWVYARDVWNLQLQLGDVLGAPFTLDDAELGALDTGGILTF